MTTNAPHLRVVIIGAGVVGASVAAALRGRASVTIVDAVGSAAATSRASFAWACAAPHSPRSYVELNHRAMRFLREFAADDPSWFVPGGSITVSGDPERMLAHYRERATWGIPVRELDREEISAAEPALAADALPSPGVQVADEFAVQPALLTRALMRASDAHEVHGRAVTSIERAGRGPVVQLAGGGSIEADVVVNAAGARGDAIARMVGRALPLRPSWGLVVRLQGAPALLRGTVVTDGTWLKPEPDGIVCARMPALDLSLVGPSAPFGSVEAVAASAAAIVPALGGADIVDAWVGERPEPVDGFPSIGFVPGIPGYAEAVMHSGVTLGPYVGSLLADAVVTGAAPDIDLAFRAERFA